MKNNIIVIKIWTNSLFNENKVLNKKLLLGIARQIYEIRGEYNYKVVLVSSWAVWLWRSIAHKSTIDSNVEKQFYASIGQAYLINEYQKIFEYYNMIVSQILITKHDLMDNAICNNLRSALNVLMENDIITIINENDVTASNEIHFSDNDELASMIAKMLWAQKLIILSDVDGLYDKHPTEAGAKKIDEINNINDSVIWFADSKKSSLWRWGMLSKLTIAKWMIEEWIEMIIAKAATEEVLIHLMKGERLWTVFKHK